MYLQKNENNSDLKTYASYMNHTSKKNFDVKSIGGLSPQNLRNIFMRIALSFSLSTAKARKRATPRVCSTAAAHFLSLRVI